MSASCKAEPAAKSLLVQWVGSFGEDSFEIISADDIVLDEPQTIDSMRRGDIVVVRCGNMKSPAHIIHISENTEFLTEQRDKMKQGVLKEIPGNVPTPKKAKKRRMKESLSSSTPEKMRSVSTQTEMSFEGGAVFNMIKENASLHLQLQEYKNMLSSLCSNLKTVVSEAEEKVRSPDCPLNGKRELAENKENKCTCPVIELQNKVLFGTGKTEVSLDVFNNVNWLSYTAATRKLLTGVFPREILATHSLTGKPSPAFLGCDMPLKAKLDPVKVADIVAIVTDRCGVSDSMVRSAITTKCADENKMFKKRLEKK